MGLNNQAYVERISLQRLLVYFHNKMRDLYSHHKLEGGKFSAYPEEKVHSIATPIWVDSFLCTCKFTTNTSRLRANILWNTNQGTNQQFVQAFWWVRRFLFVQICVSSPALLHFTSHKFSGDNYQLLTSISKITLSSLHFPSTEKQKVWRWSRWMSSRANFF